VDPASEDLRDALLEANGGRGVDVVLEMSGGRVFDACFEALAPFGRLVAYGIAGREPNTVESGRLMQKSRAVIGFWLMHCLGRRAMMEEPLADLDEREAAAGPVGVEARSPAALHPPRCRLMHL
jgi:NADPH:quinone reductase